MKTDDWVERERKKFIAKQDQLEKAQIGYDNDLLLWVMLHGRERVDEVVVGAEAVNHINKLRKAGYITNVWNSENFRVFAWSYLLTKKALTRLEHLTKQTKQSQLRSRAK